MVTFYFDLVCPYAYVAAVRLQRMEDAGELRIDWRPLLLGGVLKAVGQVDRPMDVMAPAKVAMIQSEIQHHAALLGLTIHYPDAHPLRMVDAMRALTAASPDQIGELALKLWHAYWGEGADLSDLEQLLPRIAPFGLDASSLESARSALRTNSDEAVERGVFGVPTCFVGEQKFWGADRVLAVRHALGLSAEIELPEGSLEVFHDFSSPYAYLGVIPLLDREPVLRPMVVGSLFVSIGTPMVPLNICGEQKRIWIRGDLEEVAARLGLSFQFSPHFPLRSVLALRVALIEPSTTRCIYEAAWARGLDIGSPDVLASVLREHGFDADGLISGASDPSIKAKLHANTDEAIKLGVPGAPCYRHAKGLFWGQDRLALIAELERADG